MPRASSALYQCRHRLAEPHRIAEGRQAARQPDRRAYKQGKAGTVTASATAPQRHSASSHGVRLGQLLGLRRGAALALLLLAAEARQLAWCSLLRAIRAVCASQGRRPAKCQEMGEGN